VSTVEGRGNGSIRDKVVLITGASSGIGRAIAVELGRRGASVVVNYIGKPDRAQEVVREIESEHGIALPVEADVSSSDQVSRLMSQACMRTYLFRDMQLTVLRKAGYECSAGI